MEPFENAKPEDQIYEIIDQATSIEDYQDAFNYMEEEGIDEFEATVGYIQEAMYCMQTVLERKYTDPDEVIFQDLERIGTLSRFRKAEKIREHAKEENIIDSEMAERLEDAMSELECAYENITD